MTDKLIEPGWLLDGKDNLLRMRQEFWLTEADIAILDRAVAALDRLLAELSAQ
jgi:hypothetical protein